MESSIGVKRPHSAIESSDGDVSMWKNFYDRATTFRNQGEGSILQEDGFDFPENDVSTLHDACDSLSDALEEASKADMDDDTTDIKQALGDLRKAYDEAKKSKVTMRYIDVAPPNSPFSPLRAVPPLEWTLARPWMEELISGLPKQPHYFRLVVIGDPGSGEFFLRLFLSSMPSLVCIANYNPGKSVALVAQLLFDLIAQGERVILQSQNTTGRLGFAFDDNGVHEVFPHNYKNYIDGRPCYLLVSADGVISPLADFDFCHRIIVVTSPNFALKKELKDFQKQTEAETFIAPAPSCHEVVYLLYVELLKNTLTSCPLTNLVPNCTITTATLSIGCIENGPKISAAANRIAAKQFLK